MVKRRYTSGPRDSLLVGAHPPGREGLKSPRWGGVLPDGRAQRGPGLPPQSVGTRGDLGQIPTRNLAGLLLHLPQSWGKLLGRTQRCGPLAPMRSLESGRPRCPETTKKPDRHPVNPYLRGSPPSRAAFLPDYGGPRREKRNPENLLLSVSTLCRTAAP